jgi:glutamate 5-kinase
VGTTFAGHDRRLPARKLWIAFAAEVRGAVVVDEGARQALTRRSTSLLPAGVREVMGSFGEGDTVDVRGADGTVFARGMVFVTASDLRAVAGMQTRDLPDGMVHEVIHRDDLVVLSS